MTLTMAPNKEFIASFMICFMVGLLMMVHYGATTAPLPSVNVRDHSGATNSWRDVRIKQNLKIAKTATGTINGKVLQGKSNSKGARSGQVSSQTKAPLTDPSK